MKPKPSPKSPPKRSAASVPTPDPVEEAVIPVEVLASANVYFAQEAVKAVVPCVVCGADTTESGPDERLCWVCRRLKISAWRDSEPMPAQE